MKRVHPEIAPGRSRACGRRGPWGGLSQRVTALFIDGAFLHYGRHALENPDVGERIAGDRDDVG
jgi:hypothetical protein